MSDKCRAYSESKLGLEPADNRKAFYAGWDAAIEYVCGEYSREHYVVPLYPGFVTKDGGANDTSEKCVDESDKPRRVHVSGVPYPVQLDMDLSDGGDHD